MKTQRMYKNMKDLDFDYDEVRIGFEWEEYEDDDDVERDLILIIDDATKDEEFRMPIDYSEAYRLYLFFKREFEPEING